MTTDPDQLPIQFITPLPPLRSGIAQYSADLLHGLSGVWPISVVPEGQATSQRWWWPQRRSLSRELTVNPTIIQLGNSENHELGLEIARRGGQMIVLHDVVLHHALLAIAVNRRKTKQYRQMLIDAYGSSGDEIATSILTGRGEPRMMDYPLSEPLIGNARLTVVHNHVAERLVRDLEPSALVMRIPMGVPLPVLTPQIKARRALQIPETTFVIASITHVNPMKRLDVVIRALASVVKVQPNARLIIAGSVGAGVDLQRIVNLHNLEAHVDIWGYIDDSRARLLARAADVCVNLRHPTAGETSASLLRLLGAAKPVLITDNVPTTDLPLGVGIRIPVDRFEAEMVAEVILALASDPEYRESASRAARTFVEQRHTMGHMIDGYRSVIEEAFGIEMPPISNIPNFHELSPQLKLPRSVGSESAVFSASPIEHRVADAITDLGLSKAVDLDRLSTAITSLGLDRTPQSGYRPSLDSSHDFERLRCPHCGDEVVAFQQNLECLRCHRSLGTTELPDIRPTTASV